MAMLLKGADAARALTEQLREQAEELKKNGTEPCLAILRVVRARTICPMSAARSSAARRSASRSVRSCCPRTRASRS